MWEGPNFGMAFLFRQMLLSRSSMNCFSTATVTWSVAFFKNSISAWTARDLMLSLRLKDWQGKLYLVVSETPLIGRGATRAHLSYEWRSASVRGDNSMKTTRVVCLFVITASFVFAQSYDDLVRQGKLAVQNGQYSQAIEQGRRAINLDGRRPDAYVVVGSAYAAQGRCADARPYLQSALDGAPESQEVAIRNALSACGGQAPSFPTNVAPLPAGATPVSSGDQARQR